MLVEEGMGKGEQSVGFRSPAASMLFFYSVMHIYFIQMEVRYTSCHVKLNTSTLV